MSISILVLLGSGPLQGVYKGACEGVGNDDVHLAIVYDDSVTSGEQLLSTELILSYNFVLMRNTVCNKYEHKITSDCIFDGVLVRSLTVSEYFKK